VRDRLEATTGDEVWYKDMEHDFRARSMRRAAVGVWCAALLTVSGSARQQPRPPAASRGIAIMHVSVFTGDGATMRPDMTVLIEGDRISKVGSASAVHIPSGARVLDGSGKYLIPGLWDMHTHLALMGETALPELVTYGVTSVRDMGGDAGILGPWARETAAGTRLGPAIEYTSPVLESATWLRRVEQIHLPGFWFPNPAWKLNPAIGVADEEAAERAVDSVARLGSSYVKFRTLQSAATFFAIARAARRNRLPLVGHSPTHVVSLEAASDSGLATLEHLDFGAELDSLTPQQRAALYARLVRNNTWFDPTLVSGIVGTIPDTALSRMLAAEVSSNRRGPFEPLHLLSRQMLESFRRDLFVESRSGLTELHDWERDVAHLAEMRQAGVRFLAGTDLGALWVFPGLSLHDELLHLVRDVGFSPAEVLRIATHDAAERVGQLANVGTVEPGKRADLVLLDADPLLDIRDTRQIAAVVVRGRLLDRSALLAERRRALAKADAP
jgi:predicted amidohydrolase YtcJ